MEIIIKLVSMFFGICVGMILMLAIGEYIMEKERKRKVKARIIQWKSG